MYAQADLRLSWSHIPHCWKSHVAAHIHVLVIQYKFKIDGYQLHEGHSVEKKNLKAPITVAAKDKFMFVLMPLPHCARGWSVVCVHFLIILTGCFIKLFFNFRKTRLIFHVNHLLADDSHGIS